MAPSLRLDRGTLVMSEVPACVAAHFTWDARSQSWRAPGHAYRAVVEALRGADVPFRDSAAAFEKLELGFAREVTPYAHQTGALSAWKRAGRRGVVVLPTGAGKTLVAQLALRDTPRSALICVPTLDLLQQWYAGLVAAFPDTPVGLLGGGSHDEAPLLVSTYDSAAIHAEALAGRYALQIFDEAHHLPSDFTRVIAEMGLAPYRLGLTATPKRGDGRERDLDSLIGPVVYQVAPEDLAGDTLAEYREVVIRVRLSAQEQRHYDDLIRQRNEFLRLNGIRLGSLDGWKQFIMASGTPHGRRAMLAHREAKSLAYGTDGKLRVLEEILANHPQARTLLFTDDNATVYRISREFLIPAITHQTPVKERHTLLERFRRGEYRLLVTSRVLNEGVDVPEASVAVVLSGTATEREHIQRLGRILRKAEGKTAVLYEVITEGTSEERVSRQRRGQWQPGQGGGGTPWEDLNASD
ncbi:DEAD/DEAH box helicase family protein [Deinococcus taeanensis]|uniref:DEAD/DEAH box helicase family protein n=1 Tax=Deinococcus taeanensis TaxID=2737050 RepID=UPI001CDBCC91|nr:DEAD/DEAH box helicase family protein [Deinococcus taeanensis]UBV42015.1 DEAD/DEAH box helicase family protein [Deinococcus taeanensis]